MAAGAKPEIFLKKNNRFSTPIKASNISDLKVLTKGK